MRKEFGPIVTAGIALAALIIGAAIAFFTESWPYGVVAAGIVMSLSILAIGIMEAIDVLHCIASNRHGKHINTDGFIREGSTARNVKS